MPTVLSTPLKPLSKKTIYNYALVTMGTFCVGFLWCVLVNESCPGRHGVRLLLLPQCSDKPEALALWRWQRLTD